MSEFELIKLFKEWGPLWLLVAYYAWQNRQMHLKYEELLKEKMRGEAALGEAMRGLAELVKLYFRRSDG